MKKFLVNLGSCGIYGKLLKQAKQRGTVGVAAYPKQLKSSGIKSLMERAIRTQGVEKILKEGTIIIQEGNGKSFMDIENGLTPFCECKFSPYKEGKINGS